MSLPAESATAVGAADRAQVRADIGAAAVVFSILAAFLRYLSEVIQAENQSAAEKINRHAILTNQSQYPSSRFAPWSNTAKKDAAKKAIMPNTTAGR
jgi:hypothetical protein